MIYTLPTQLEVDNVLHDIRSDFRAILDIIAALNDGSLTEGEKRYVVLKILYIHPENLSDTDEAMSRALWFLSCGDDTPEYRRPRPLMSWETDFPIIVAPVNRILGYECRLCEYLHWWTFISAYNEIGECFFQSVVSIRNKKAKGKKLEKWEQEFYSANRDKIDLPQQYSDAEEALFAELGI